MILTSNRNLIRTANSVPVSISDHDLVYVVIRLKRRHKSTFNTNRNFKMYHHEAILRDISLFPWSVVDYFDEVHDCIYAFNLLFNNALDEHAPMRTNKLRGRPNPCITDEIKELMQVRDYWRNLGRMKNRGSWPLGRSMVSGCETRNSQLLNIPLFMTSTGQRAFDRVIVE